MSSRSSSDVTVKPEDIQVILKQYDKLARRSKVVEVSFLNTMEAMAKHYDRQLARASNRTFIMFIALAVQGLYLIINL